MGEPNFPKAESRFLKTIVRVNPRAVPTLYTGLRFQSKGTEVLTRCRFTSSQRYYLPCNLLNTTTRYPRADEMLPTQ